VISIQLDNKYPQKLSIIYFKSYYEYRPYSSLQVASINALLLPVTDHPGGSDRDPHFRTVIHDKNRVAFPIDSSSIKEYFSVITN